MSKSEMIDFIISETRKASRDKDPKKRERKLSMAKLQLIKSTDAQVEKLYEDIKEKGAEEVFNKKD